MRTNIYNLKASRILWMAFALLLFWHAATGQNNALHFDGDNDYIDLNPIAGFPSNTDFTVEMWFYSTATGGNGTCIGDFRRLFSLGASGPNRFEVGECMGILSVNLSATGIVQSSIDVRDNKWHCIAAVRSGATIDIYLDGVLVPGLTGLAAGGFVATLFRVGHWPGGGNTFAQDWMGYVDEVKLWKTALSAGQLTACNACVLKGNEQDLVAYWKFDEGAPAGNNTALTTVVSSTGSNAGTFSSQALTPPGFDLGLTMPNTSNFVVSGAPLLYPDYSNHTIQLLDPNPPPNGPLTAICDGDAVHFSILNPQGIPTQAGPGTSVDWYYSDDCNTWLPINLIPPAPSPSAVFSGFSFVTPPGHLAMSVPNCNPNGYIDRCYRAVISVTNNTSTCTYTVESAPLRICCKVSGVSVVISPPGPFCEGDLVLLNVSLNGPTWVLQNIGTTVQVSWCLDGIPLGSSFDNLTSFPYSLGTKDMCFKAIVTNCVCPAVSVQTCVKVDLKPVCGTITGSATPATLMDDPDNDPDHYLICPGDDAAIEVATPFTNCNKVWEYSFSPTGPWSATIGASNNTQNTNVLPHLKPANSPYLWPLGATCIYYRIKCLPLTYPNSGCPPCYSNVIRICLKTAPPVPVITAVPNPICKGDFSYLSVQNFDPNCTYEWHANGLLVGNGNFLNTDKPACYWVTCYDGCFTVESNRVCLQVCETVAKIDCPIPICPCIGDKITLDGSSSYSTCGYSLTYTWTWVDEFGVPHTFVGPVLMDIPAATGTTYTLTVTDTVLGCTDTAMITVIPCP